MSIKKHLCLIILTFSLFCGQASSAQVQRTVKRSVATVLFSTLGGAILGLSTLPFYGEPQDHIDNVTLGALIGGLAGVGYLGYEASQSFRQAPVYDYSEIEWHLEKNKRLNSHQKRNLNASLFVYSF
ncbi:hypothetical protein BDW_14155 [Bdellovibrio bacteriovorus W]|nr:hypothetical protein BDW_14155 [Bdellovibrio bacteriovorus W]